MSSSELGKVRIVMARESVPPVVSKLFEFGSIQVVENVLLPQETVLPSFKRVSELLISLRLVAKTLGTDLSHAKLSSAQAVSAEEAGKRFDAKFPQVLSEISRLSEIGLERKRLEAEIEELQPLSELNLSPELFEVKSLKFYAFKTTQEGLSKLKSSVSSVPNELFVKQIGKEFLVVVASPEDLDVSKVATKKFELSKTFALLKGRKAGERIGELKSELVSLGSEESSLKEKLAKRGLELNDEITLLIVSLEGEALRAQLPAKFGRTQKFSVVEGWVPKESMPKLKKELGGGVVLEELESEDGKPTMMANLPVVNDFELLTLNFSTPKSFEVDPTFFVALTFPLFFGMIVGDIGYGLVILALSIWLRAKSSERFLQDLGMVLAVSAISSIVFGFVFAEFFGFEEIFGLKLHPVVSRVEETGLAQLMKLSVLMGVVQLSLGFVIGALVKFKEKHYKHAVGKFSWLLLLLSMVSLLHKALGLTMLDYLAPLSSLGTGVWLPALGVAIVVLFLSEGGIALIEIPSLLGNVFSYLRLMALGVSGVIIAGMINQVAKAINFSSLDPLSLLGSVLLLVVFVIAHALSLGLAVLEAGIQSIRLHYVEFFSKFFEGGGVLFKPLKRFSGGD